MAVKVVELDAAENLEYVAACEICGSAEFTVVGEKDRNGAPLHTVLCDQCGLVFTNPRPTSVANERFYRETYRLEYKQTSQPLLKHTYRAGRLASERFAYVSPFMVPHGSVLDVGAGGGEFLFLLRSRGYTVQGIEPNVGYAEFARKSLGLPVTTATYQQADIGPESQDMVTSFHVFEHLDHPLDALLQLSRWAKLGGCMFVEVPNVLSECQWPHSRFHRAHQYHFSPTTLAHLGTRIGLAVLETFTSKDSGNAMAVFQKTQTTHILNPIEDRQHASQVRNHLKSHTWLRHLFSPYPYVRPITRFLNSCREQADIVSQTSATDLLSKCAHQVHCKS